MILNVIPYEETFMGSNYKTYKHKYYLAYMKDIDNTQNFQTTEVSCMKWLTFDKAMKHIRPYNSELREVLTKVDTLIREYDLVQ